MTKNTVGYVLIVLGAVISLIAAIADLIGLGNQPGVGWQQLLLLIFGIYLSLFGFWQVFSKSNS